MGYQVMVARQVRKYVDNTKDQELKKLLKSEIESLKKDPFSKGHQLKGKLSGFKSLDNIKYKGIYYRIIFKCIKKDNIVKVMDIGTHEEYNIRLKMGFN